MLQNSFTLFVCSMISFEVWCIYYYISLKKKFLSICISAFHSAQRSFIVHHEAYLPIEYKYSVETFFSEFFTQSFSSWKMLSVMLLLPDVLLKGTIAFNCK